MPTVTLIENDIWRYLKEKCKPKHLNSKPVPCKVTIEVDADAYKALDDDPLLLAKLTEAASEEYYNIVNATQVLLRKVDGAMAKEHDPAKRKKLVMAFNATCKKNLATLKKNGKIKVEKAWADVAKTKTEYRTYKIKAGVDLAIDSLNVVAGVASAVGSGGFALIVTIYGLVKTLVGMAMKIYKLAIVADKLQKRVKKNLEKVQKSFNKKKKEVSGAKDTGKAFINSLLGADFIPTISSVKADNDQYKSKIQGVDVASHSLAKKLNEVLKEMDKVSKMPDVKSNKKVSALLSKLQSSTQNLIDKIVNMQTEVRKGIAFQMQTSRAVKELETLEPKKWKIIQKGLPLIDITLAGGDFSKAGETLLGVGSAIATEADKQLLEKV